MAGAERGRGALSSLSALSAWMLGMAAFRAHIHRIRTRCATHSASELSMLGLRANDSRKPGFELANIHVKAILDDPKLATLRSPTGLHACSG